MEVGVVGKPNVGKSTFFNALTLLDVPIAPYPFTTITPNRGVAAVRFPCPHVQLGHPCTPGNARCVDGTRWVPVNLVDVPGLVPGAHEGRGLGRQFLDDLRAADGFLQVVDLSGATTDDGVLAAPGTQEPAAEVTWLHEELIAWVADILGRDFDRHAKSVELEGTKIEEFLQSRLTGLSVSLGQITAALRAFPGDRTRPSTWTTADRRSLAASILYVGKPRLVVANKCDRAAAAALGTLGEAIAPIPAVATSAEAELTLRRAARAGLIEYVPGASAFSTRPGKTLSAPQERALAEIRAILGKWGTTGVQTALETMVFQRLGYTVVFPVEDETRWTDSKDRVLPDALLVPAGTTARAMAYRVHTDLGDHFIRAIDARSHRALGAEHPLDAGAVVRIVARK